MLIIYVCGKNLKNKWKQDQIQVHPTGFVDPNNPNSGSKFLAPEALRAYGAVMLNAEGRRFGNELARRDVLSKSIFDANSRGKGHLPPNYASAYLVMTDPMIEQFGKSTAAFYAKKGLFVQCEGLEELAKYLQVDQAHLKDEFARYDMHVVECKNDTSVNIIPDSFGKTVFPYPITYDGTYWVGIITPCVHYTMGGLVIDIEAAVLSSKTHEHVPGIDNYILYRRIIYVLKRLFLISYIYISISIRSLCCG